MSENSLEISEIEFGREEFTILVDSLLIKRIPVIFAARGLSMEPEILDGDRVKLEVCSPESVSPGQIVAYRGGGGLMIIHRIVETFEKDGIPYFQAKGDSNKNPDPPAEISRIMATAVRCSGPNPDDQETGNRK